MQIPIFDTVLGGISVIGSIVGTRQDLADVFALHAAGRTRVVAETRKLDEINTIFDEVLAGQVPARVVLRVLTGPRGPEGSAPRGARHRHLPHVMPVAATVLSAPLSAA